LLIYKFTSDTTKVTGSVDSTPGVEITKDPTFTDDAEIEEANLQHHVTTLIKASKDGTELDPSYDAILKGVMKNNKSRDALMKAFMEHTKLFHSRVADLPKAVEITGHYVKPISFGVVNKLTPPFGTRGFLHQVYQIGQPDWTLDVYAYRHAHSNDVTVIVLHSGSSSSMINMSALWTTPATANEFHYPVTYDSKLGDDRYSYHIDYTRDINMIGPDGKNPISIELQYSETFIAQFMSSVVESGALHFTQGSGQIYGMSVFNASLEVDTALSIGFAQLRMVPNATVTGSLGFMV